VDCLLRQSGTLDRRNADDVRIMDSNDQERERGITILAKNTAINYGEYRINIVDTPGHADFGGEVERVLSMVDSVLLLVDAVDGPMPQTRFVTSKAFAQGLRPIVVINKVDRPGARPDWVVDQVFDLFDSLGASEEQLDFPIIFASALEGTSGLDHAAMATDMTPLFETVLKYVPAPDVDVAGPLQLQISALDYNSYVGVIGVGRITRGVLRPNTQVAIIDREGKRRNGRVLQVMGYMGLERIDTNEASAGDIVCVTGLEELNISDTLCDPAHPDPLPALSVDEPTVSMTFQVNDSPFAGKEGKYVTSRNIAERLKRELIHNVALRVEPGETPDKFKVSGRGELHLSVLIESMRREGFELGVSRPEVIRKEVDGVMHEPFEELVIDCEDHHQGALMEELGARRAELKNMSPDGKGWTRLEFIVPARGLIGFRSLFLTLTSGSGTLTHIFDHYGPIKDAAISHRNNGVLVSMVKGKTLGYGLYNLQDRGRLFVDPNIEVYEGQIIGLHSRGNDLTVNPTKAKQLTNVRASGTDEALVLTPPTRHTLEQALEFIEEDELVEVTPVSIRLRKKLLLEHERKRASRG
ncbi:MAG: translational GTPase TypA, partial [Congregibacter sp.]|nr:translational GTPase TypA [Congregibacter sp.]